MLISTKQRAPEGHKLNILDIKLWAELGTPNSHAEALTPEPQNGAVSGDRVYKEGIKVNEAVGWALIP